MVPTQVPPEPRPGTASNEQECVRAGAGIGGDTRDRVSSGILPRTGTSLGVAMSRGCARSPSNRRRAVDTIRHPRELRSTGDRPPPGTSDVPVPGRGTSPPADLGSVSTIGTVASSAHVSRSLPPVVNPPFVALALTVLFLLVLLVAVLLGPDGDPTGADESADRAPAPAVDTPDGHPVGR